MSMIFKSRLVCKNFISMQTNKANVFKLGFDVSLDFRIKSIQVLATVQNHGVISIERKYR